MATEKQVKCVYALSKKLGLEVDWSQTKNAPYEVVSERIEKMIKEVEQLKEKVPECCTPTELNKADFSDVGFGLAVKMVEADLRTLNQTNTTNEKFTELVKAKYIKHTEAKRAVKAFLDTN